MSEHRDSRIIDCVCGLRYMRTAISIRAPEIGHVRCTCGNELGSWSGWHRLHFEPEDVTLPPKEHVRMK